MVSVHHLGYNEAQALKGSSKQEYTGPITIKFQYNKFKDTDTKLYLLPR